MGQQAQGLMSTQPTSPRGSVQLIPWGRQQRPRRHSPALSCLVFGFATNHAAAKAV